MPIRRFVDGEAFDAETIKSMNEAFAGACLSLGLADRDDLVTRVVAQKIIELAHGGEHDPKRLEARTLRALQQET